METTPTPPNSPHRPPFYRRRGPQITTAVVVFLFAGTLIGLPFGIGYGVKQWILANGGDQVSVQDVDFNPFTATLGLHHLEVHKGGARALWVPELDLHLSWHPLWEKQIVIDGISIKGVRLQVDRSQPGVLQVGGIVIDESSPEPPEGPVDSPWGFAVEHLRILDTELQYRDPRLDTRLRIDELKLSHLASFTPEQTATLLLQGTLDGAALRLEGRLSPFAAEPGFEVTVVLDALDLHRYGALAAPAIDSLQGQLALDTRIALRYTQDAILDIRQDGALSLTRIQATSQADGLDSEQLRWDGRLDVTTGPGETRIKAAGQLTAKGLDTTRGALSLSLAALDLPKLDLDLTRQGDGAMALDHTGELALEGLTLRDASGTISQQGLHWAGATGLEIPAQGPLRLTSEGTLESQGLDVRVADRDAQLAYQTLAWKGRFGLGVGDGLEELDAEGTLHIRQLHTDALSRHYTLVAFEDLQAGPIRVRGPEQITVDQVEVRELTLGQTEQSASQDQDKETMNLFQSALLRVEEIGLSKEQGLTIAAIEEHDVTGLTWRDREGRWNVLGLIDGIKAIAEGPSPQAKQAAQDRPGPAAGSTPGPDQGLPVRIGRIRVSGDSRLVFADDSLDPPLHEEIRFQRAELRELDSTQPQRLSPLEIQAIIGQDAKLHVSGGVAPFAQRLSLDLKVRIEGLPLPPLSSYTAAMLGYRLDSGELDADIALKAEAGRLEGENKLYIHQFEVTRLSPERLKALHAKATLPLDTGLAMLKDKHNTIELDIPLSGEVEELKIDPSDIINTALAKAMQQGAKTYLAAALFPFGTLLTVAHIAGEQAMKVRLDPIVYGPGSTELDSKDREYLDKVAKVMGERPKVYIRVCGVATEADRNRLLEQAQAKQAARARAGDSDKKDPPKAGAAARPITDAQLRALAKRRAAGVERYLIDTHQVKANRLIACQPELDKKAPKAKPRTELLI